MPNMHIAGLPGSGPDLLDLAVRARPPGARVIGYGCYNWTAAANAAAATAG